MVFMPYLYMYSVSRGIFVVSNVKAQPTPNRASGLAVGCAALLGTTSLPLIDETALQL